MRLTFVVTAISRIKTAADDFMLKFRFRLDRQLKSFIAASPSRPICSHFYSVYFWNDSSYLNHFNPELV